MPVEYRDYYKILGVKKDATTEEVKKAYRRLARQYHPDVSKSVDATKRFKEVNEANEVLSDPEKRRRYDTLGPQWEQYARGAPGGGGFQWVYTGAPGAGFGGESAGFSDFFRTLFGDLAGERFGTAGFQTAAERPRTRSRARIGADAEHEMEVTLADAYRGTHRSLEVRRQSGVARTLEVTIPAGVRDGQRIRLGGQGGPGFGGGQAGDLYLRVRMRPHPLFQRDGDDLRADLPIALHEALLGAEVTVPALKGRVSLKIPPETQNGRTIRLAGQGMPRPDGGFGDLYVTVKVVLPQKLSETERDLARELAAARRGEDVRGHLL